MTNRTKFLYDPDGKPIGRVDENGNVLTMNGRESHQYLPTKRGTAINKSHLARLYAYEQQES